MRSTSFSVYRRSNVSDLSSLAWRCCVDRLWTLRHSHGASLRPPLIMLWIDGRETPIWEASFLFDRRGFRRIGLAQIWFDVAPESCDANQIFFGQQRCFTRLMVRRMDRLLNPSFFRRWKIWAGDNFCSWKNSITDRSSLISNKIISTKGLILLLRNLLTGYVIVTR